MPKDSMAGQLYEACGRKRTAAMILEYFIVLFRHKQGKHPKEPVDSPKLWLDFTQRSLSGKYRCSIETIARHLKTLASMKFITPHQVSGYNRRYHYELNISKVESIYQSMPLFEGCQPVKMPASNLSKCRDATCQNAGFEAGKMPATYIPSHLPNTLPSPSGVDDDDLKDEEKEKLINSFRTYGVAREKTEFLLTQHSRQKMFAAVECLQAGMRKINIPSPGGYLVQFLREPWEYGYEMDKNGCWVRAGAMKVTAVVTVKPYISEESLNRKWKEKARVWEAMAPSERHGIIEGIPINSDFERARILKWKSSQPDLETPPSWVHGLLEEVI